MRRDSGRDGGMLTRVAYVRHPRRTAMVSAALMRGHGAYVSRPMRSSRVNGDSHHPQPERGADMAYRRHICVTGQTPRGQRVGSGRAPL